MAISTIKATLPADVKEVWDLMTSLTNYAWRSDLSNIEIVNEKQFIEYTEEGYATTFTVTKTEKYQRWEFDMENTNMQGHWTGIFTAKADYTELELTENISAKKLLMKPFVKGYLKKQQKLYVRDLAKALGE